MIAILINFRRYRYDCIIFIAQFIFSNIRFLDFFGEDKSNFNYYR